VTVKLFVEGGGDTNKLRTDCRRGFSGFLRSAGIGASPRIVARGSRESAYQAYKTAIANGELAMLLVDSEGPVSKDHSRGDPSKWQPWSHLKQRDAWEKPPGTPDTDCHLMVQVMESWVVADPETLEAYFGKGFDSTQLPGADTLVEDVSKDDIARCLAAAAKKTKKKGYQKGRDSFRLLEQVNGTLVIAKSGWAKRFVAGVRQALDRR